MLEVPRLQCASLSERKRWFPLQPMVPGANDIWLALELLPDHLSVSLLKQLSFSCASDLAPSSTNLNPRELQLLLLTQKLSSAVRLPRRVCSHYCLVEEEEETLIPTSTPTSTPTASPCHECPHRLSHCEHQKPAARASWLCSIQVTQKLYVTHIMPVTGVSQQPEPMIVYSSWRELLCPDIRIP